MTGIHDELHELAGAFVLGSLTAEENRRFADHLRSCDLCRAEVGSLEPVARALALSPPIRQPSPDLKGRILEAAGASPSAPAQGRPTWHVKSAWLAAAAAVILATGLGGQVLGLRGRVAQLEVRLEDAAAATLLADRQVAEARLAAEDARTTATVLVAPDLARVELVGEGAAPGARARAFWSRANGLVFTAFGLPALAPGTVYQLWVVTSEAPVSAGLLTPDASGRVSVVIETPADLPDPVAMAVTLEPAGGVSAPTGQRYLVGTPTVAL